MKIIDYEKKYKDALVNMQELYNSMKYMSSTDALHTTTALERAFPELKEGNDKRIKEAISYAIANSTHEDGILINGVTESEAFAWLEKQSEQKPAWGEEDMRMIDLLVAIFEVNYPDGCYKATPLDSLNVVYKRSPEIIDWLKSLKKRVYWKPSEEQLNALDGVYKTHGANGLCRRIIFNLLEQLKKL